MAKKGLWCALNAKGQILECSKRKSRAKHFADNFRKLGYKHVRVVKRARLPDPLAKRRRRRR